MVSFSQNTSSDADLVFTGGPVLTMDPRRPRAEAVAVTAGRIVAVGSRQEVSGLVTPRTRTVDLQGRALLPGFVDPHMHSAMVQLLDWVDVSPMSCPSADAVFDALTNAPATDTGWVLARQVDPTITAGHPVLDRQVLDRLVPDRPLLVLEGNGHIAHVNSQALARAGVDRDTPDPPAGRYTRDAQGEPTGRLEEPAALGAFVAGAPMVSGEDFERRIEQLLWTAAAEGVTLLHDCGIGAIGGMDDVTALRRVVTPGSPVRYRGMLVSGRYDAWLEAGLRPGDGDDLLRIEGIKAWADGSNQAGTGYQREPYLHGSSRGALNHSPDELARVITRAHADGWQVGVHANGDAAIDVTLDGFERALAAHPRGDHRHRIEHCSVLHPEQIERMHRSGLSPSFLIGHLHWWGAALRDRLLGPERMAVYDPCASALRAGLRISLHSDWNVTPLEPLRYVQDAVTRRVAATGEVIAPAERIGVEAALRAVTADAAWQCGADAITGSLQAGKYADLAVLEADPTAVDPERIAGIGVSETYLAGQLRHSS